MLRTRPRQCVAASPLQSHFRSMSDIATSQIDKPFQLAPIATKLTKIERVTGKVRNAIDAMVWEGLPRSEAAAKAGISEHGLYKALRKPPVKAYYLSECEMLRTSGRARRIHRLEAMLEQSDNKAAVINAALALEGMGNDQASVSAQQKQSPGVVIQIINAPTSQSPPTIELTHD
jgi:hypothetical protein